MNVILHHRTQGRGVEAVHLRGISKGFMSLGHDVRIVSPLGVRLNDISNSTDTLSSSSLLSSFAQSSPEIFFEFMEICNNFIAGKQLENQKQRSGCDILYERHALMNYIGAVKAKQWGVKFVVEVNYTTNSPLDIRKRTRLLLKIAKKMEKKTFDLADLLLPVSSTLESELRDMGYPEEKILVSPNAVFPEDFNPDKTNLFTKEQIGLDEGITIGYVGGFAPWHGLDILIQAVSLLKNECKKINLLLIGDGPMRRKIIEMSERMEDCITMILPGRVRHSELHNFMSLSDIMVMPNSNDYGSPMKIFEYMAMKKPVIAPDYPPLRDVIKNRVDGMLIKPNNYRILSETIQELMRNKMLMDRLGENARKRVIEEHNWYNRVQRIVNKLHQNTRLVMRNT